MKILVVDDNTDSLQSLNVVLADLGHHPVPCQDSKTALALAEEEHFPLVITDIRMPGVDGLELLARIKRMPAYGTSDVIIITGHGDMETAIEALRKGAYDYLNKPINARELAAVVERSAEHQALLRDNAALTERFSEEVHQATTDLRRDLNRATSMLRKVAGIGKIVAESQAMRELIAQARIYHENPSVPVLIEGETGSGKEIIARLIHHGDAYCERPFVAVNCSAFPENLFESELFGYEPGAFTGGAKKGAKGKIELSGDGTLFLDEVSEMPLVLQPKLLRVLEEKNFYRVGGIKLREFKARVICAGNQNLDELVNNGRFRPDLFHRLKVGHIRIPPLRERQDDIGPLIKLFITRESLSKKRNIAGISPEALRLLQNKPWPGNIRELENTIQRAVLMCDRDTLEPRHFEFMNDTGRAACAEDTGGLFDARSMPLPENALDLSELNDTIIRRALAKFNGNKTKTSEYLGISRYALHRKLRGDA